MSEQKQEMPTLKSGDVARMLNVSAGLVSLWARTGAISAYKTGPSPRGHWRFSRVDVERFVRKLKYEQGGAP